MRSFWLFRTNLRPLEYYHEYTELNEFQHNCHDFYLIQGIWFLQQGFFDEVVIWRMRPKNKRLQKDIIFEVGSGKFIQRFVDDFSDVFKYSKPDVTFFRGGFPEYCQLTKKKPEFFGLKLYLGASKRKYPVYGGGYDKILVECESDLVKNKPTIPFYKTSNARIFYPIHDTEITHDICWPCNFSQIRYKGQEFFIRHVAQSKYLKSLKILHSGNKPEIGKKLCETYAVNNIEFLGWIDRPTLNKTLNQCKVGLVTSNLIDGCPRISTEVMNSGAPLVIRKSTRLFDYYKLHGVIDFEDNQIEERLKLAIDSHVDLRKQARQLNASNRTSIERICKMNLLLWGIGKQKK